MLVRLRGQGGYLSACPALSIPCVGAVATDGQGRLLMIKRGREPGAGLWSIPGGPDRAR